MLNYKVLVIAIVIAAGVGAGLERKFAPLAVSSDKVVIVDKYHTITVVKTIVQPGGAKEIDTTITSDGITAKNENVTVAKLPAKFMLGAGYAPLSSKYEANAAYRLTGPVWLTGSYNTNNEAFIGLRVEF